MKKTRTILITAIMASALALCGTVSAGWSELIPVAEINTLYFEGSSFLSFDGLTLYFGRTDTDTFYYTRVFQATRSVPSGPFTVVEELSTLNYSGGHLISPWVSSDNLRMYYYRTEPGSRHRLKVSERASIGDSWLPGANIEELNVLGNVQFPTLSEDELIIVFAADLAGGMGAQDIWMATRPDKYSPFGSIRNVTELNTSAGDDRPTLSGDGLALYFDSDRSGDSYIWKASRLSTSEPFGDVQRLDFFGTGIHGPSVSGDGKTLHFSKLVDPPGQWDIYVSYLVEDGLVGHWKFDEGGGSIAYDSAGDNDGVVYGAQWADGVLDGALAFDGVDDYVEFSDEPFDFGADIDFSVSVWVMASELSYVRVVDKIKAGHQPWEGFELSLTSGIAQMSMNDFDLSRRVKVHSTTHVSDGSWHLLTAVAKRGDNLEIYVDGEREDFESIASIGNINNDIPLAVGRSMDYNGQYFAGSADDVRIYDRALSAGEVLALYEDVPEPPESEVYHVDGAGGSDFNDGLSRVSAFATIGKGIGSSVGGGEVLVWPGVYGEQINFDGKAITVKSAADAAVIEAVGQDAVSFAAGEGPGSVLSNFVIRRSATAIACNNESSPTLRNLTIADNDFGIAAYEDSNPDISDCILWDNRDGDLWGCQARNSFVEQEIETGPVDGLIGHWRFDEGGGTTAGDSAGSSHGDISGAQWVMGELGGALSFDGVDDYVSILNSGVFDVNDGDISMSMWFKTSEYADQTLMKFRQYDDDPHLEVYTSTVFGNIGSRAMPGGAIVAYNAGRIDDGAWHHVAVSVENGTTGGYKLYLDGMLVGMTTFSGDLSGWEAIAIGNDADDGGFFNGSIDDVRVYSRAISSLDAYLLYEMAHGGPVAHWKFDEGAGSIAYDSAGSNDGVVYGAQWATGQVNGALNFDGVDDYIDCGSDPSLDTPELTWALWIKRAETTYSDERTLISCDGGASGTSGVYSLQIDVGMMQDKLQFIKHNTSVAAYSNTAIQDTDWHHIAVRRDASGAVVFYIDGQEDGAGTAAEKDAFAGMVIGTGHALYSDFYGSIDDVRIYDRALSAGEVELLFNGGVDGQDDVDRVRPLFANAGAGDYHLLSERGRYWPAHDVWVLDKVSSPCIDTGDPAIEPTGEQMPNGGALNIGAYGGTAYASMSEWPFAHDSNRDGKTDFKDVASLCDEWLMMLPWAN